MTAARRWARGARTRTRRWRVALVAMLLAAFAVPLLARAATGSRDSGAEAAVGIVFWGSVLAALLVGSGGYGAQRRSGTAVLWLQKPVRGPVLYLHRLVGRLVVTALFVLLVAGSALAAVLIADLPLRADQMATLTATTALMTSLLVCVTWGVSGWGLAPEPLLAILVFGGLAFLSLTAVVSPDSLGYALPAARLVGVPLDPMHRAGELLATGAAGRDLVAVLGYAAGWVLFGVLGLAITTRSPLGGEGD